MDVPHQYILKPVSGESRIIMKKKHSKEVAKTDAQVFFDEIGFVLDDDQYRDALSMLDLFHFYTRTHMVWLLYIHVPPNRTLRSIIATLSTIDIDRQTANSPNRQPKPDGSLLPKRFSTRSTNGIESGPGSTLRRDVITGSNTSSCMSRRCPGMRLLAWR